MWYLSFFKSVTKLDLVDLLNAGLTHLLFFLFFP